MVFLLTEVSGTTLFAIFTLSTLAMEHFGRHPHWGARKRGEHRVRAHVEPLARTKICDLCLEKSVYENIVRLETV